MRLAWKHSEKNHVFHAEEHIYNLQISLSELVSLSGSSLFSLSVQILTQWNFLYTMARSTGQFSLSVIPSWVGIVLSAPFSLSETSEVVVFKIPMVRLCNNSLGSSTQNLKIIQRLTNLGSWFYWNRFRQNLKSHNFNLTQQNST